MFLCFLNGVSSDYLQLGVNRADVLQLGAGLLLLILWFSYPKNSHSLSKPMYEVVDLEIHIYFLCFF